MVAISAIYLINLTCAHTHTCKHTHYKYYVAHTADVNHFVPHTFAHIRQLCCQVHPSSSWSSSFGASQVTVTGLLVYNNLRYQKKSSVSLQLRKEKGFTNKVSVNVIPRHHHHHYQHHHHLISVVSCRMQNEKRWTSVHGSYCHKGYIFLHFH